MAKCTAFCHEKDCTVKNKNIIENLPPNVQTIIFKKLEIYIFNLPPTIKKIIIVKIKNNEIMHLKKLPFNCKIYDKNNQLLNPTF